MSRYGYQGLTVENFVGFHPTPTSGQWAAVELTPYSKKALHEAPVLVFFKPVLMEAIDGLGAAQGADNDVQRCDGPWDDAQRPPMLARAVQEAVGAFNLAHTGLEHLVGAANTPEQRARPGSMMAPFHDLLARRPVAAEEVRPTG